jgi:hypothetical protein
MYLQGSLYSIFINNLKKGRFWLKRLTREINELMVQVDSNKNDTTEMQNKLRGKTKRT